MLHWDDLRFFLAIVRTGSLTGAARGLRTSQPTVSRRLASIEKRLGVTLLERTRRGYELSQAGAEILDAAERIQDTVNEIERRLFARDRSLTGELRVTCTEPFANLYLCRFIHEFADAHPGLGISLSCTLETVNLSRRDADVAIRITGEPPPALIGRKIARVAVCAYGSVEYLRARPGPDSPRDWIGWRDEAYNRLFITDPFPHARIKHRVDDIQAMHTMTRHGLGLAALPCHMGDPDPALRRIVSEPILDGTPHLWILYHPDVKHVARVRLFVDFLVVRLLSFRSLFEGGEPHARTAGAPSAGKRVIVESRLPPVSPPPA